MKTLCITIVTISAMLCTGLLFGQNTYSEVKVDSPFRLVKGVILKSDLRMKVSIPVKVIFHKLEPNKNSNTDYAVQNRSFRGDAVLSHRQAMSIIDSYGNTVPSGIVVDGVLANDNSQRLNAVLFPPFGYSWQ